MDANAIARLLPELTLILSATAIYVAGAVVKRRNLWHPAGLAAVVAAAALVQFGGAPDAAGGDATAGFVRSLALLAGGLFLLLAWRAEADPHAPEQAGTILLATCGVMFIVDATDLATLFLGLELVSIPTYVLLNIGRHDRPAQEATVKYFFLSVLSSAILLYGFSFLYGATGTLELKLIKDRLPAAMHLLRGGQELAAEGAPGATFAKLAMLLITAGLGFKIGAAPFHFYAPDVYQGASAENAGVLSVFPKIAGTLALVRLLTLLPASENIGWWLALVLAIATMTIGNFLALWQKHVRRLLACSSIAHSGYLLVGVAVTLATRSAGGENRFDPLSAILIYLTVYTVATAGVFAVLSWLSPGERDVEDVEELAGLARTRPLGAMAMAVCLLSLAGAPPLAGFWGKFSLFAGALSVSGAGDSGGYERLLFIVLAVAGMLNAAVAAAYYLRIVGVMYFQEAPRQDIGRRLPAGPIPPTRAFARTESDDLGWGPFLAMIAASILVVALGLVPGRLIQDTLRASPKGEPAVAEHRLD